MAKPRQGKNRPMTKSANLKDIHREIVSILRYPPLGVDYCSDWLKASLIIMIGDRDPLDAAYESKLLAELLAKRSDAIRKFITEHRNPLAAAGIVGEKSDEIVRFGLEEISSDARERWFQKIPLESVAND